MNRGFTLIECMFAVAILGIFSAMSTGLVRQSGAVAATMVRRERALQVLEYHASAIEHGVSPDPAVARTLLDELPEGTRFEATRLGKDLVRLQVRFETAQGRPAIARLVVVMVER